MSDTPPPNVGGAAEPEVQKARKSIFQRISIVWLVPIAALLISLAVVWQSFAEQGRLIEVVFDSASGVRAEETQLRYRDVVVGLVEGVRFTEDLDEVLVEIRLDQEVSPYVDSDAQFWVVQPQVSAQGVSGLDTVLGGVYIEGNWDSVISEERTSFAGSESPPLVRYGQEGVTFRLRSSSVEGLSEDTPILYRGITVGRVANLRLGEDNLSVVADAFVRDPESQLINSATRFWDTSGFTFRFGASGAQLDVNSIASLVTGGVSFDTTVSGGEPLEDDAIFRLFGDEETARASVFADARTGEPVNVTVVFEDSVPGLEVGADVVFNGIDVGDVGALTGLLDEERFGDRQVRLLTTLELQPGAMGLEGDAGPDELLDFLGFAVENGLRAQLQSASLLGGLQIGLVQLDDVEPAAFDLAADPYPLLPSVPADLTDFADTAEGVFNRVNNLPIEELLGSAITLLDSANSVLTDDGVSEVPQEVLSLLTDIRGLVNSEGVQDLPDQASEVMTSLEQTAEELNRVVAQLAEAGAVEALVDALNAAEEAANSVYVAVDEVPETLEVIDLAVAELEQLVATVNDLPLSSVVAEAEGSVAALRALLSAPETQGLTGDVSSLLLQVDGLLADVRQSGLIETANATLVELQAVVGDLGAEMTPLLDEARQTLITTRASVEGVPAVLDNVDALTANVDSLVQNVNALPLDRVVDDLDALLLSTDSLISQASVRQLPTEVTATLTDIRALLGEVTDSALVEQAVQTLATTENTVDELTARLQPVLTEAERAATSVAEAADMAPEIAERAQVIAERVEALVNEANELPLDELTARASRLLESADALVSSPDAQRVPGALADSLAEVQRLLIAVQEGGLIENANSTLSAAEEASQAIAQASDELPGLVGRMNALLLETEGVISGYEASGQLGSEVRSTLRDIRGAAQSVDSLSRQIERAPNSLLFGR